MDIYRYFHPHHNPRLYGKAVRLQELYELEQAAAELRKALARARKRTERKGFSEIGKRNFDDVIEAARFLQKEIKALCQVHPGDTEAELLEVAHERSNLVGWNNWSELVDQSVEYNRRSKGKKVA